MMVGSAVTATQRWNGTSVISYIFCLETASSFLMRPSIWSSVAIFIVSEFEVLSSFNFDSCLIIKTDDLESVFVTIIENQ